MRGPPTETLLFPAGAVRRAAAGDEAVLAELGARTFRDTFAADNTPEDMAIYLGETFGREKQAAELADPAGCFLIAEIDRVAVGYARLREGAAPACVTAPRPIEIARIYAEKSWHGRGVGPALLRACLDEAAARGCGAVWLGVWDRNLRARAFYRKWGFVEIGAKIFPLGRDRQNDVVMQARVVLIES
ncbi:MAG TPA: GNAT family N-acetyltransferase [Polyangiaceae bacterium]|nr:GNAT family N-acetyltransferase [Polyangiaceae bacterium]